jgi:hypothetical protein
LVAELSPPFVDEPLELGRDILCDVDDGVRELSLTLEIKRVCTNVITQLFLMIGDI